MVLNLATRLFGTSNDRTLKKLRRHVEPINALEPEYERLSDDELRAKTDEFRQRHAAGESLDDLMHEAFAVVREASKRTLGLRHFDVQLIGGVALHQGQIAEMKTGEGKTLVAVLAVYLNALNGKGAHVITVNDYLARRDTEWMGQLYNFLGLSVGSIIADMPDDQRKQAYACDVTYGTNNEFGFDYLRDNMKFSLDEMVQREYNFAIVDEVDSILIDEARTPLIISGPSESATDLYVDVDKIIPELEEDDYEKDEKMRTVHLTETGVEHAEQLMSDHGILTEGGLYDAQNMSLVHHLNQALRAHKLFERDTDYIVKNNKVVIIDEFTGRMMEGRRFSEGLHQALEAKEGVEIQSENQTLASITFQNYFRLYPKLAGMTGTAMTEASEFMEIYSLGVVSVPTNEPVRRMDHDDQIYKSLQEKEDAIVATIKQAHEKNQPALVGTVSIDKSEQLSARLKRENVPHNILNARYHEREAYIIAQAGRSGMVTIATNMAGRGTDIKLGGNPEMRIDEEIDPNWDEQRKQQAIDTIWEESQREREEVVEAGGLYIVGTERHESRRIDNQLRGRSGRQGDPGESQFFLSTEDDLMRIFSPEALQSVLANKNIGLREGEPLTHPWLSKALERAQSRVEHQNFETRKNLLKFDNVMNDQRTVIYEQRREIMESETVEELVTEMRHDVIRAIVANCIPEGTYPEQWDVDSLQREVNRILNLDVDLHAWAAEEGIADQEIIDRLIKASDSRMAEKAANAGRELFRQYEKALVLQQLDQHWKEHLLNLDHLREGINLRAFGQRDPLNEYKTEAFALFENMLSSLRENITHDLSVVEINMDEDALDALLDVPDDSALQQTREDPALRGEAQGGQDTQESGEVEQFPVKHKPFDENDPQTWSKVGRNTPCPCGSGMKYKHCHGKVA